MKGEQVVEIKEEKDKRDRWEQGIDMMNRVAKILPVAKFIGYGIVLIITVTAAATVTWTMTTGQVSSNKDKNEAQDKMLDDHDSRIHVTEGTVKRIDCKVDIILAMNLDKITETEGLKRSMVCAK